MVMQEQRDRTEYTLIDAGAVLPAEKKETGKRECVDKSLKSEKEVIQVNDLDHRVCYFSLAGDQALKAFEEYYIDEHDEEKHYQELRAKVTQRLCKLSIPFM